MLAHSPHDHRSESQETGLGRGRTPKSSPLCSGTTLPLPPLLPPFAPLHPLASPSPPPPSLPKPFDQVFPKRGVHQRSRGGDACIRQETRTQHHPGGRQAQRRTWDPFSVNGWEATQKKGLGKTHYDGFERMSRTREELLRQRKRLRRRLNAMHHEVKRSPTRWGGGHRHKLFFPWLPLTIDDTSSLREDMDGDAELLERLDGR